ncbi:hypothetical protein LXL04_029867 [Taraxacum kok-saghyz]
MNLSKSFSFESKITNNSSNGHLLVKQKEKVKKVNTQELVGRCTGPYQYQKVHGNTKNRSIPESKKFKCKRKKKSKKRKKTQIPNRVNNQAIAQMKDMDTESKVIVESGIGVVQGRREDGGKQGTYLCVPEVESEAGGGIGVWQRQRMRSGASSIGVCVLATGASDNFTKRGKAKRKEEGRRKPLYRHVANLQTTPMASKAVEIADEICGLRQTDDENHIDDVLVDKDDEKLNNM